jgi:alpha-L-fucosidase
MTMHYDSPNGTTFFKAEVRMKSFLRCTGCCSAAVLAAVVILPLVVRAQAPKPFGPVPNARQVEWFHREAQVFLHFGVNTFNNVEWGSGSENPSVFNPTALNCGQWMRIIRSGGFNSAILVAKHHDGFCNWPSAYTTQDVASSPWRGGKGDLVREFVDSARAYGIKPGIYMSIGDFHSEKLGNYAAYYLNQESEILHNYGKIWEIWWDGANAQNNDVPTMTRYTDSVHKWTTDCVIWSDANAKYLADARWIGTESGQGTGDPCWATENWNTSVTPPDWSSKANGTLGGSIYCPAEVNSSCRTGWFWHQSENNSVNTVDVMWNKYFQSVGRNCTWLYNLPPDTRGLIYQTDSLRVDSVGSFIYGTFKAPHANLAEGATVTTKHPRGAGYEPANLVDASSKTYYATPDNIYTDTITVDLGSAKTFDCLMLREVIELGHRTTGWSVDYSSDNSSFTSLLTGKQSIGYKWLEKFNPVTARYVRLKITKGQACVALNTFGVYKKTFLKWPSNWMDTASDIISAVKNPAARTAAAPSVAIQVFGRSVELPSSLAARPFTAALLDLRGRTLAVMRVDSKQAPAGNRTFAAIAHPGLYLVKCTGESGVVLRKFIGAVTD